MYQAAWLVYVTFRFLEDNVLTFITHVEEHMFTLWLGWLF